MGTEAENEFDYIVVGSGAGGGPLAANLAKAGYTVLLMEAGGDAEGPNYEVPVFHAKASEDPELRWDFFVRHYEDEARSQSDPKYQQDRRGVLYPRSGTLGGCTAHNAMICVYPHNSDWDHIADVTGDDSWRAPNMRRLFQRLEKCRHRGPWRLLQKLGWNPSKHGFRGWLRTEKAIPLEALGDGQLVKTLLDCATAALKSLGVDRKRLRGWFQATLDPNDWRLVEENAEGIRYTPLSTDGHARTGTREHLRRTQAELPDKLFIELNALATRVLLDDSQRCYGVEYLKGAKLYRAHAKPSDQPGERRVATVRREVIVSGGAFNTPQLLMLSGIGPREELERRGVAVRVESPGVGRNLQDRYEVGVVTKMKENWSVLEGSRYEPGDSQFIEWERKRTGVYTTNGAVLAVIRKSQPERPVPDLFLFALLGKFRGYFPKYSEELLKAHNYLTWAVLKAHTNNTAGVVSLASSDPRDPPHINFKYFEEGNDRGGEDLESVVEGIEFVRGLISSLGDIVEEEELPGPGCRSREELRDFVRTQAWGHHASCTCKIGAEDDPMAVLDSRFRVRGTDGLRVVDASVFPKIPGFFIVSAVYMISEKASDSILADAGSIAPPNQVAESGTRRVGLAEEEPPVAAAQRAAGAS